MDFQTFNYDKDKIFNYIQSIENDCDKINYLQRLNVEIEKVIISFNSAISTLNSTILFETHKQSRKLIDNIQYLFRHEHEYVIKVFDAYLKTEFLCYDNLAVVLSSYFNDEISAEIKTGLRTDIYYSFIKWSRKENTSPRDVLKYSEFYLKNFNEGSVYHNSTTDKIVIRLYIKRVVDVFVSEMQDLNDIKSMVNNKFKYYQKLSELKDQTEPIPDAQPETPTLQHPQWNPNGDFSKIIIEKKEIKPTNDQQEFLKYCRDHLVEEKSFNIGDLKEHVTGINNHACFYNLWHDSHPNGDILRNVLFTKIKKNIWKCRKLWQYYKTK